MSFYYLSEWIIFLPSGDISPNLLVKLETVEILVGITPCFAFANSWMREEKQLLEVTPKSFWYPVHMKRWRARTVRDIRIHTVIYNNLRTHTKVFNVTLIFPILLFLEGHLSFKEVSVYYKQNGPLYNKLYLGNILRCMVWSKKLQL